MSAAPAPKAINRYRFFVDDVEDPRPVIWPIPYPYWISGYGGDSDNGDEYAVLIAYGQDEAYIQSAWPGAKIDFVQECAEITFTSRFPRPDWYVQGAAS